MTGERKSLRIRPSHLLKFQDCPRAYQLQYVDGIRAKSTSINLYFGTALHHVFERAIRHHYKGLSYDASKDFEAIFRAEVAGKSPDFPKDHDFDTYMAMGKALASDFWEKWPRFGLEPLVDDAGEPIAELNLKAPIAPGVELTGTIDLPCINRDMQLVVLDHKTARSPSDPNFVHVSDQLTGYQVLLDANQEDLGTPDVSKLGFLEAIKRKVSTTGRGQGPQVQEPVLTNRRTDAEIEEFKQKVLWMVDAIHNERFPRTPRMAFNSPCNMCDFASLCLHGDTSEVIIPDQFSIAPTVSVNVSNAKPSPKKRAIPKQWMSL